MTIDEAINYLREDFITQHPYTPARSSEAKQLGIEALRELKLQRKYPHSGPRLKLPSETPEPPPSDSLTNSKETG